MDQINLHTLLKGASLSNGVSSGSNSGSALLGSTFTEPKSMRDLLPKEQVHRSMLDHCGMTVDPELIEEARRDLGELLAVTPTQLNPLAPAPAVGGVSLFPALLPSFIALKGHILEDLQANLSRLLTLNPSRREAVANYLDRLAGLHPAPSAIAGNTDVAAGLRRWIEGPRTPAQVAALHVYFEEMAFFLLGQALILKSWSDRSIRSWSPADLKDLHWALNTALKKHIPHDRENWLVAKVNIYSWYKPGNVIQGEIWETLGHWHTQADGPQLLLNLFSSSRQGRSESPDPQGYDSRFYQAIWSQMSSFGFNPAAPLGPLKRSWLAFSPTLRDGALARTSPESVQWIGLETSPFQLMIAEFMQLWWKPSSPPLWSAGSGLEVHSQDQLSLTSPSINPKPSLLVRITEMEACDVAFVLEERSVRTLGRSPEAQRFREQLDCLPYFKKLKAAGTSLGDLQACVALSKLRPGGLLWWAREEALTESDGREMLCFALERAKMICEWDFSQLEHALPGSLPLFSKHLYLFVRDPAVETRLTHRPNRVCVQGQMRSHVELPIVLQESLASLQRTVEPRGPWKIHSQKSPSSQRDWMERWPDLTSQQTLRNLEALRDSSVPLASVTTVRHTPDGDPARDGAWNVPVGLRGFWIHGETSAEGRKLVAKPLPYLNAEGVEPDHGSGYLILVADATWGAPLARYLESEPVRTWLDHHAERKGERWTLNEQVIRAIPVPKALLQGLGLGIGEGQNSEASESNDSHVVSQILQAPEQNRGKIGRLSLGSRVSLFNSISWELEKLEAGHGSFLKMVTPTGKIRWGSLLKMLPQAELQTVPLHQRIRTSGNLPLHMAIGRIERVKAPQSGILFTTEAGFHCCVSSETPVLIDMISDQLEGLQSPTWSELVTYLRLPRRVELAETTAGDILRHHGEQARRTRELTELLSACSLL